MYSGSPQTQNINRPGEVLPSIHSGLQNPSSTLWAVSAIESPHLSLCFHWPPPLASSYGFYSILSTLRVLLVDREEGRKEGVMVDREREGGWGNGERIGLVVNGLGWQCGERKE